MDPHVICPCEVFPITWHCPGAGGLEGYDGGRQARVGQCWPWAFTVAVTLFFYKVKSYMPAGQVPQGDMCLIVEWLFQAMRSGKRGSPWDLPQACQRTQRQGWMHTGGVVFIKSLILETWNVRLPEKHGSLWCGSKCSQNSWFLLVPTFLPLFLG